MVFCLFGEYAIYVDHEVALNTDEEFFVEQELPIPSYASTSRSENGGLLGT